MPGLAHSLANLARALFAQIALANAATGSPSPDSLWEAAHDVLAKRLDKWEQDGSG
jgi:hypothetical protein